jgi:Recombination endonuclease VII
MEQVVYKRKENMEINGKTVRLAVDHCHDGGETRGLLCQLCNRGLGFFKHSKKRLLEAVVYLERFN